MAQILPSLFSLLFTANTHAQTGAKDKSKHTLSLPVNSVNLYSDSKMLRGPVHAALLDLHSHESLITIQ